MPIQHTTTTESGLVVLSIQECGECGEQREHRTSYPASALLGWTHEEVLLDAYREAVDLLRDVPCSCYRPSWER